MATRIKTEYPGVVYIESTSKTGKTEKIFYIYYRKRNESGKLVQVEEKVGRSIRDNMTAAKANRTRTERIEGRQPSNNERRAAEKAARDAESNRWTIARLWELFQEHKAQNKSLRDDRSRWRLYLESDFASKEVSDLITLDVSRVRLRLLKKGLAPATVKQAIVLLKRIINHGVKQGVIPAYDKQLLVFEVPDVDNEKTDDLTPDELARLLAAIEEDTHEHAGLMMKLALFTGMRRGELFKLKWSDIDFAKGFITIQNPKGKRNPRYL